MRKATALGANWLAFKAVETPANQAITVCLMFPLSLQGAAWDMCAITHFGDVRHVLPPHARL
ncbi:MAG: hypothetical protein IPI17_16965 [Nitrosomonas sp.]|nr:hypothetical protein [Nitrosomonas sp.]